MDNIPKKTELERKKRYLQKLKKSANAKLKVIRILFIICIIFLSGVILYTKNVHGKNYEMKVLERQLYNGDYGNTIQANRGNILDRNKQSLAVSYTVFDISLDIKNLLSIKNDKKRETTIEDTFTKINKHLKIPINELKDLLNDDYLKTRHDYTLAKGVSRDLANALKKDEPSCVFLKESSKREYPHNNLASHLIGFIREDNNWGLEKAYNDYLTGVPGRSFRSAGDLIDENKKLSPPQQGHSLITTLDLGMQEIAEKAVQKAVDEFAPENAAVVLMNPYTGEIYSWAQYPNFNLNAPSDIEQTNNELLKVNWDNMELNKKSTALSSLWRDFIISDTFEPGSIYKPIVIAAALEEGFLDTDNTYFCSGIRHFKNNQITCWNKHGHGTQTLKEAIANSCNMAMIDIADKLGPELYFKYQKEFGYGELTDIDLPNEASSENLLNTINQLNEAVYLATNSMGQGFNCTVMQSLTAFSAVINGGYVMQPYVVSQIINENGGIVSENKPTVVRKVISKETSNFIREILRDVVTESGTGRNAVIEGYDIGGKTGTGQQGVRSKKENVVSFIAYLSVENPEIIAVSIMNKPPAETESSASAVPMLKEVLVDVIKYKGIPATGKTSPEDNFNNENQSFVLPDYTSKSIVEVSESLNNYGIDYDIVGTSGSKVKTQVPIAASQISRDKKVYIYLEDTDVDIDNLVSMPNVTEQTVELAKETLIQSGFVPVVANADYIEGLNIDSPTTFYEISENGATEDTLESPQIPEENISKKVVAVQMPNSGTLLPKGTYVRIKVK